ncbi:H-type small acid-soluble spore protein [Clostridium kluyveri]|uniref:Small, acid-soluble spore protein, H family n=1 Tax=Clostridium kluyveri TaxID=1534 RepID=A0A1L5F939_CLOKL|nr:H-type small acid-soluble spore protein [Clostridium kluyveri]APM39538.1 small, acid-soluble spore protein, H family [Clostridium kluyveri]UZQ50301.1 H-type small acid-soluble spore protein [Clostridium kluyveri]
MDKNRVKEILESKGIIEVKYKNNPVWLESISTDKDDKIQVKDLNTNEHFSVNIIDLKE